MKFKKMIVGLMACAIMMAVIPVTAYAKVEEEPVSVAGVSETVTDEIEAAGEKKTAEADSALTGSIDAALTPDGNLTLVDDIGSSAGAGQQFITLVTKAGNTFYLVIDRNDKGEENVHFLNLVDEADLFALLDEDQQAAHQPTAPVTQPEEQKVPEETTEKADIEEAPDEPEKKGSSVLPFIVIILLMAGAGGGYFYLQFKKKQTESQRPDPDADYDENEGEDEFEFPEEEDADMAEEFEDSEEEE